MRTIEASAKEWLRVEKEFTTEALPLVAVAISMSELQAIAQALQDRGTSPILLNDVKKVIEALEYDL
jgi:hypothetical protein